MPIVRAKYHPEKVQKCPHCGYTCLPDVEPGHVYLVDTERTKIYTPVGTACKQCRGPITVNATTIWAQGHGYIYMGMLEFDEGVYAESPQASKRG